MSKRGRLVRYFELEVSEVGHHHSVLHAALHSVADPQLQTRGVVVAVHITTVTCDMQAQRHVHTCVHAYIHVYTHIHACIHTHVHAYVYTHTYTHMHTYKHTYMYTYMRTCIHTCIHTHTHMHTYTRSYIHTYIHTYILIMHTKKTHNFHQPPVVPPGPKSHKCNPTDHHQRPNWFSSCVVQYNTIQYNTRQYTTIQYNAIQFVLWKRGRTCDENVFEQELSGQHSRGTQVLCKRKKKNT